MGRRFVEAEHPRHPAGTDQGGRFRDQRGWRATLGSVDEIALNSAPYWAQQLDSRLPEPAYQPGQWRQQNPHIYYNDRYLEAERMLVGDGMPASAARQAAEELFENVDAPLTVYRNGPHAVVVESDRSDIPIEEFLAWVDRLETDYPARSAMRISIVPGDFPNSGQVMAPAASMILNEKIFDEWSPNALEGMPVQRAIQQWKYVLTHEWGHVTDPFLPLMFTEGDGGEMLDEYNDAWTRGRFSDLSRYGGQNSGEAYAEAFAEWYLSKGRTGNAAANDYASRFGWA